MMNQQHIGINHHLYECYRAPIHFLSLVNPLSMPALNQQLKELHQ